MERQQLIAAIHPRLTAVRRDLHAHPELAFAETRTADIVARCLGELGIEVHRGLARTGVVGRLRAGGGSGSIGLRADMDALPLAEVNDFAHRSTHAGRMHACGHDGHTTMLLGAAEVLARTRAFDGTVHFIFQPAEEMAGGGKLMVDDGLFDLFPMDSVYALHNWPGLGVGEFAVHPGPMMAGADVFEIRLRGRGAHAAMPHQGRDVILAGTALVQALQSLVARNVNPQDAAVVSVTRFNAGQGDNVLPDEAVLGGTVRMLRPEVRSLLEDGMRRVCRGIESAFEVVVDLDYRFGYPPTVNAEWPTALAERVARNCFGDACVHTGMDPAMGSEDFAFFAEKVPACYAWLGNGSSEGGCVVHSPKYDFNDAAIPHGVRFWVELVEAALAPGPRG
jgi:hippurate hydrolase